MVGHYPKLRGYCGWPAPFGSHGKPLIVGIHKKIIIPSFLKCCRNFVHETPGITIFPLRCCGTNHYMASNPGCGGLTTFALAGYRSESQLGGSTLGAIRAVAWDMRPVRADRLADSMLLCRTEGQGPFPRNLKRRPVHFSISSCSQQYEFKQMYVSANMSRSSSREVRIRVPFLLKSILVGEPSPTKSKRALVSFKHYFQSSLVPANGPLPLRKLPHASSQDDPKDQIWSCEFAGSQQGST